MKKIPYIPESYLYQKENYFQIWFSPTENKDNILFLSGIIEDALSGVETLLNYSLNRNSHVCLYATNAEAIQATKRNFNSSMLLAPFSSQTDSLIICQSENPKFQSRDNNFKRHLVHEIAHAFLYELSGSEKILGDNNIQMNIPAWFNEGFAECVSNKIMGNKFKTKSFDIDFGRDALNDHLNDINSPKRPAAFDYATGIVESFIIRNGHEYVFKNFSHFTNMDIGVYIHVYNA
ncbi:MAG: hypothetical protein JW774_07125 [Candidatus Aureabacteria bacterium]|nr:hypothetical protein [Candidatus Auribacterota bacterium]